MISAPFSVSFRGTDSVVVVISAVVVVGNVVVVVVIPAVVVVVVGNVVVDVVVVAVMGAFLETSGQQTSGNLDLNPQTEFRNSVTTFLGTGLFSNRIKGRHFVKLMHFPDFASGVTQTGFASATSSSSSSKLKAETEIAEIIINAATEVNLMTLKRPNEFSLPD